MPIQRTTIGIINAAVSKKEAFKRGNVSGKWVDRYYFGSAHSSTLGKMSMPFSEYLSAYSEMDKLYVLFSYQTPMAWFNPTTGKWYYVDTHYSQSTTNHQHNYRMALKGENVVTLSEDDKGYLVQTEKEYY